MRGEQVIFRDLFWSLWKEKGYKLPTEDETFCFTFDMYMPSLRKVIYYNDSALNLFAVRNLKTLQEVDPFPFATKYGWETITSVAKTWTSVTELVQETNASKSNSAGYLLIDDSFRRLYIETPLYKLLKEVDSTQDKPTQEFLLLKVIVDYPFETETLLHYPFERSEEIFQRVLEEFQDLCDWLNEAYEPVKHLNKVEFNKEVEQYHDMAAFLYFIRDGSFDTAKLFFERDGILY
jgi:hypothetical protein